MRKIWQAILIIIIILGGGYFCCHNVTLRIDADVANRRMIGIALAATQRDLVINEIAWMGTDTSASDEWLELYNNTDSSIDIGDWSIYGADTSECLNFSDADGYTVTIIRAHSYLIYANKEDDVKDFDGTNIVDIWDATIGMNNTSPGQMVLYDTPNCGGNVIDTVNQITGEWFAGDSSAKQTMERISSVGSGADSSNWGTNDGITRNGSDKGGNQIKGTPKAQNSNYSTGEPPAEESPEPPPPPPAGGAAPPPVPPKIYSDKIIINELLINPEDSDADNEFVELYNDSDVQIDLSGWVLEDIQGSTKKFTIPQGTIINAREYKVFYSGETRLVFNNSGDGVKLFWPVGGLADSTPANSGRADDGMSYARDIDSWLWSLTPTPGEKNEILNEAEKTYLVTRVIDGDTIELASGEKLRYIGIDTPEISHPQKGVECFGPEASEKNQELVLGKEVRLEKDVTDKDDYGRLLRYVYTENTFVNEYLVRQGYAYSSPYPPDTKYQEQLNQAENEARAKKRGFWQVCEKKELLNLSEVYSDKIIINEFLPNPKGPDFENEWIELKNIGEETVNLDSWKLSDATSRVYAIKVDDYGTTTVLAQEYFLIKREVSGIALNNTGGDKVRLFWPNGDLLDEVNYADQSPEEMSYARDEGTDEWAWTLTSTPKVENRITMENKPPVVFMDCPSQASTNEPVLCDASDSYDPEAGAVTFLWTFDNASTSTSTSPSYTFNRVGVHEIHLAVTDAENLNATAVGAITIFSTSTEATEEQLGSYYVYITELLPNPEGADSEAEFIELYNTGNSPFDISGWQLDDVEAGGSQPYTISPGTIIGPDEYLTFGQKETGLALNNNYDSARLIDLFSEVVSEVIYDDAVEAAAYALTDTGGWQWTNSPTPGKTNKIISAEVSKISTAKYQSIIWSTLEEVRSFENNTPVKVQGMVTVEPGILGSMIFYIQGSPGIQVYSYKKDFPTLAVGDLITVSGTLSESGGEKRIKTSTKNDIGVISHQTPPEPRYFKNSEIEEGCEGQLVTIKGELIEKSGSSYYLDDGNDEVRVYIKTSTGIEKPQVKEGMAMTVTGIVSQTSKGYVVLPRYQDDIRINQTTSTNKEVKVINLAKSNPTFSWERYLWVLNGALIVVVGGLYWKKRRV